jgi:hypothetical protein
VPQHSYAGWAREAVVYAPTYPAASAALVTELLPLVGAELHTGVTQAFTPATDAAQLGYTAADTVSYAPTVTLHLAPRYRGLEALFACALGLEARRLGATLMPEQLAPGVYRHLFEVDHHLSTGSGWVAPDDGIEESDLLGGQRKVRRGTLAVVREFSVWEFLSVMWDELTLAWTVDQGTCTLSGHAHSLTRDSAVNTLTSMQHATLSRGPSVLLTHAVLRLAPYSTTTPLDSTHETGISSWTLSLKNQLTGDSGPRTGLAPEEYERSAPPLVTGTFTLPRYRANTLLDAWPLGSSYMLDLKFTGGFIGTSGYHYALNLYVPGLVFTSVEPTGPTPSRAQVQVAWQAVTPAEAPAGFPSSAKNGPMLIEVLGDVPDHQLL